MKFEEDATYHIYNRSNEVVFQSRENYLFFLGKVREYMLPYCNIMAWCLMPNHFHFLLQPTEEGILLSQEKHRYQIQILSLKLGLLISSYTQAYNKVYKRRGRLFAHQTKAKMLNEESIVSVSDFGELDYSAVCMLYIHQNPVVAGLVDHPSAWEMSSYNDFTGQRNGSMVNKELAFELTRLNSDELNIQSNIYLDEILMKKIF
ncbi:transposase [Sunxiuqinia sp. A32]|uniref:transposase n=1 Tax=Sunxiuqinia sp. A32 TaxID=3461496 RepID=UPI004045D9B7